MFDVEAAVRAWRVGFAEARSFSTGDLDELEDHLRGAYEVELYLDPRLAPAEAFERARAGLGAPADLSGEFAKVEGKAWHRLLTAGWVMFALSWFLPVHRMGIRFTDFNVKGLLLPGVEALWVALTNGGGPAGVLSGLTNLLMAATFWRIRDAGRNRVAALAGLLLASVALNLWWLVQVDQPGDLLAGYYAWTASFGVVGAGLALRARAMPDAESRDLLVAP